MAVYFNSEINRRSVNEDKYCDMEFRLNHEAAVHVMMVADGMGGLTGGQYYSETAVKLFNERLLGVIMDKNFEGSSLEEQAGLLKEFCHQIFQDINQVLYTRGLNAGIKGGTTLTVVIHFWHSFIIANCGDSPAYCLKDGRLRLVSDIQNAAWQMIREGKTSRGSLIYHQNKARLLQYLGRRDPVHPHVTVIEEEEADYLLLGTDGAFGNLSRKRLAGFFDGTTRHQQILTEIFEAARAEGEEDNQTGILYVPKSRMPAEEPEVFLSQVTEAASESLSYETAVPGQYRSAAGKAGSFRALREKVIGRVLIRRR